MARLERESSMERELESYKSVEKIIFSSVSGENIDKIKNVIINKVKN